MRGICNRIWEREKWPEEWREGVLVPIRKKGQREVVQDYREVMVMPTLYKIYTAALAKRLRGKRDKWNYFTESNGV